MSSRSNSQFVVASVQEFMNVWALGGEASLKLTSSGGAATVSFNCSLGHPGALHSVPLPSHPPHPPHPPPPPHRPRHRGPSERERNRLRAARHQAARAEATAPVISASSVIASVTSAAPAPATATVTSASPSSAASVRNTVPAAEGSDPEGEPEIAVNLVSSINFKCDQCDYSNINKKGLEQHIRMKHRMSQVDGVADCDEELVEDTNIVMSSIPNESEHERIDRHIKSIPLDKLNNMTPKELADLQSDITRKVLQEMKENT